MATLDTNILSEIQAHLVETVDAGATVSSGLWTVAEFIAAIDQAHLWLIRESMLLLTETEIDPVVSGTQRVTLPSDWLITKRVSWADSTIVKELPRDSAWSATQLQLNWETTSGSPMAYNDYETPLLQLELLPPPSTSGRVPIVYVPRPTALSNSGIPLAVPDACAHIVKWKAISLLFSKEGRGRDVERAALAQQLADQGLMAITSLMRGY